MADPAYVDTSSTRIAPAALKRVSWGAIFAGVTTALAIQITLALLGIGIGAAAFDRGDGATEFGIGAGIWWLVTGLISLFAGGYVAARLAGVPNRRDGMLHGFVTWSVATLATFYLLSTAVGSLIGGTASFVGRTAQGVTPAAVASATGGSGSGQQGPSTVQLATDPEVQNMAERIYNQGGEASPSDRQQLVELVARKGNISREQAEQRVSNYEQTYVRAQQQLEEAKQQVQQAVKQQGEEAASNVSKAALATFFMLLLGALAGSFGGGSGAPRPRVTEVTERPRIAA